MKPFFAPNIDRPGRIMRFTVALLLFVGAGFAFQLSIWFCLALAASGLFVLFEAFRGWCLLRACGIKTRL